MDSGKLCRNAESEPVQEHIPTCSKQPATALKHVSTVSDADHVSMLGLDGEIQRGRFFAVLVPRCQLAGWGCCPAACPVLAELQQLMHHHSQGLPLSAVDQGALKHGQVSAFVCLLLWGKLGGFTPLSEQRGWEGEGKKQKDFYRLKTQVYMLHKPELPVPGDAAEQVPTSHQIWTQVSKKSLLPARSSHKAISAILSW